MEERSSVIFIYVQGNYFILRPLLQCYLQGIQVIKPFDFALQPGSAFSSVTDAYGSQSNQKKTPDSIQSPPSASFTKPNVSPVPGGNSQVTYTSAPLASHVLGYQPVISTTSTQTSIKTQATTSKSIIFLLWIQMPKLTLSSISQTTPNQTLSLAGLAKFDDE